MQNLKRYTSFFLWALTACIVLPCVLVAQFSQKWYEWGVEEL